MSPLEIIHALRGLRAPILSRTMLIGAALGFGAMCILGRKAAVTNVHRDFHRFTQWTSPETKYYPTINEMMAIVRAKAKPGQILVVVGGNSVLRGVGQPANHIWSDALQRELGDGYCVVNFAFNGSVPTDSASVAAESLRKEFPRQIYMANVFPGQPINAEGTVVYRDQFWEASAKGLLVDDAERKTVIAEKHRIPDFNFHVGFEEIRIRETFDRVAYFHDYWNDVAMTTLNTVYGYYLPGPLKAFGARRVLPDPDQDFLGLPLEARYLPSTIEGELQNVRGVSMFHYMIPGPNGAWLTEKKDPAAKWEIYEPKWAEYRSYLRGLFPPELRKRTLMLLSRNSNYYMQRLKPEELERNDLTYAMGVVEWEKAGYAALDYGRDFHPTDDFGDRTHLTWHGGEKLAKVVAVKVRSMSQDLGYLTKP